MFAEWGWKHVAQQIAPVKGHYISQLPKTNLLPQTMVSQAQTTLSCSNSVIIII